jgi:hypothetical protein
MKNGDFARVLILGVGYVNSSKQISALTDRAKPVATPKLGCVGRPQPQICKMPSPTFVPSHHCTYNLASPSFPQTARSCTTAV